MKKFLDFVDKVSMDAKFVGSGEGKTLSDEGKPPKKEPEEPSASREPRVQPERSKAAQAALDRSDKTRPPPPKAKISQDSSSSFMADLEREKLKEKEKEKEVLRASPVASKSTESLAQIPALDPLPADDGKNESLAKAISYLKRYGDEIRDGDLSVCSDFLHKYADNIIANSADPKYRRIKVSNKVFVEKVKGVPGSVPVLKAAGFEEQAEEVEGASEQFLVFPMDRSVEFLVKMKTLLQEPLAVERDIQVFFPSKGGSAQLPESVYNVTKEDVAAEQMRKRAELELAQTLRTREMRERDELKHHKKYKVTKIRIRFPDGIVLQAQFGAHEKASAIAEIVKFSLESSDRPFKLANPGGAVLDTESEQTLQELGFVPSGVLILRWNDAFKGNGLSENLLSLAQLL